MLITLCYSVLTWIQGRSRAEVSEWIHDILNPELEEPFSLVLVRVDCRGGSGCSHSNEDTNRPSSAASFYNATDSFYSSAWSMDSTSFPNSRCSSAFSTPKHQPASPENPSFLKKSVSFDSTATFSVLSTLPFNYSGVRVRKLLAAEDNLRIMAISPKQVVELHEWTSFMGAGDRVGDAGNPEERTFRILLEASPGILRRDQYKKFTSFGSVLAWRWLAANSPGDLLCLILQSDSSQLTQLMHIFRHGQIILEGGWKVTRLTSVGTDGSVGTLIPRPGGLSFALTPGELRRLTAGTGTFFTTTNYLPYRPITQQQQTGLSPQITSTGIFERVSNLSTQQSSRHDITTIKEEVGGDLLSTSSSGGERSVFCGGQEKGQDKGQGQEEQWQSSLVNWCERSPRKRSLAATGSLPRFEKPAGGRRRSFCPTILRGKSSSLVSLAFRTTPTHKSLDEDGDEEGNIQVSMASATRSHLQSQFPSSKSHDSLKSVLTISNASNLLSPFSASTATMIPSGRAKSPGSSPRRLSSLSAGKPPNILLLCSNLKRREKIGALLKGLVASDRYAIYDIRWDQLEVGGWEDQTALIVNAEREREKDGDVAKDLVDKGVVAKGVSHLLQFVADGGRLLTWCCDLPPFAPKNDADTNRRHDHDLGDARKVILEYGLKKKEDSSPVPISPRLFSCFQKILEVTDSEGISRPLTATTFAKVKGQGQGQGNGAVLLYDGGSLGGKALLSRIPLEDVKEGEGDDKLLSSLLETLGIEVEKGKRVDYTTGYLLGDHLRVKAFLSSLSSGGDSKGEKGPSFRGAGDLVVEIIPRGTKPPSATATRLPVLALECPQNFSTLQYYDNLETVTLGRLVLYSDVLSSTQSVLGGSLPLGQGQGHGLVCIARQQTGGKGRGGNVWLSPQGSALFSLHLQIPLNSLLGQRLSLLQHLGALAVVLALSEEERKKAGLKVKWPNDIYSLGGDGSTPKKIGGVLVSSTLAGGVAVVTLGIGVNVSNPYPTLCLNSLLGNDLSHPQGKGQGAKAKVKGQPQPLSTEKLIAKTLTQLENLLSLMDKQDGVDEILDLYEANWIHSLSEEVVVELSEGDFSPCVIRGIDEFGFLKVQDLDTASVFSVRPDGNSFDISNRLIAIKK